MSVLSMEPSSKITAVASGLHFAVKNDDTYTMALTSAGVAVSAPRRCVRREVPHMLGSTILRPSPAYADRRVPGPRLAPLSDG